MQSSDLPTRFSIAYASSAGGGYIQNPVPVASQIGISDGRASFTDGFPPLNFLPVGAGGVPPFGADMNGILYMISAWSRWQAAGGAVPYNSAYQSLIGGYPKNGIVGSAVTDGLFWISTTENNVTNPDAGGAGWTSWPQGVTKSLFNVSQKTTSTRVLMTGNSGNSYTVQAWAPTAYVKQSATSNVLFWLTAPTYAITNGPTGLAVVVGASTTNGVASNNTSSDARGSTVINAVLTGLTAGSKSITLTYSRNDSVNWQTAFCPTNSDNAFFPVSTTTTLIIGEIEP